MADDRPRGRIGDLLAEADRLGARFRIADGKLQARGLDKVPLGLRLRLLRHQGAIVRYLRGDTRDEPHPEAFTPKPAKRGMTIAGGAEPASDSPDFIPGGPELIYGPVSFWDWRRR